MQVRLYSIYQLVLCYRRVALLCGLDQAEIRPSYVDYVRKIWACRYIKMMYLLRSNLRWRGGGRRAGGEGAEVSTGISQVDLECIHISPVHPS